MPKLERTIRAEILEFHELSDLEQALFTRAAEVRLRAQAPYSNYLVGVCVVTDTGIISAGCNVERVSYTQTTHAEQSAIDSLIARHGTQKLSVVVGVSGPREKSIEFPPEKTSNSISDINKVEAPCGHCLQIIWENCMGDPDVKILWLLPNGEISRTTIGDALPFRFGPNDLGIDLAK